MGHCQVVYSFQGRTNDFLSTIPSPTSLAGCLQERKRRDWSKWDIVRLSTAFKVVQKTVVPRYQVHPHCRFHQSLNREVRRYYWSKWNIVRLSTVQRLY